MSNPARLNRLFSVGASVALVASTLVSCQTSSATYVEEARGYTSLRGDVAAIRNLSTDKIDDLSDGFAITLSASGCEVDLRFSEDNSRTETLEKGAVIVFSKDGEYLLRPPSASEEAPAE